MKLWSKDDGRAGEFGIDETQSFPYYVRDEFGNTYHTKTLKEITDKWEDYEEPKEYWCVDCDGMVLYEKDENDDYDIGCRKIGNYFETKEEAEKAVKKLRAWKRLKDKGFWFEFWDYDGGDIEENIRTGRILFRVVDDYPEKNIDKDLDLLFGGEE